MSFDIGKMVLCNHLDYTGKYWGSADEIEGCPKCTGAGEYYDISWGPMPGDMTQVVNLALLEELVKKAILTEIGDNEFHPEYGTSIVSSIGSASYVEAISRVIEMEVGKALGQLYLRQQQQLQLGQNMSEDELIYKVARSDVRIVDERTLLVYLTIVAESGRELTIAI